MVVQESLMQLIACVESDLNCSTFADSHVKKRNVKPRVNVDETTWTQMLLHLSSQTRTTAIVHMRSYINMSMRHMYDMTDLDYGSSRRWQFLQV
jgi:hypothetical protein